MPIRGITLFANCVPFFRSKIDKTFTALEVLY